METSSAPFIPNESYPIQVQSPLPIRNLVLNRKNRLTISSRFFDFIQESEDIPSQPELLSELSLMKVRSYHSESTLTRELNNECVETVDEVAKIVCKRHQSENSVYDVRPPSRASNPQIHDEEFLRMNKNGRVQRSIFQRECLLSENVQMVEHA